MEREWGSVEKGEVGLEENGAWLRRRKLDERRMGPG